MFLCVRISANCHMRYLSIKTTEIVIDQITLVEARSKVGIPICILN